MRKKDLLELLTTYKQDNIIEYFKGLSAHEENLFLRNLERMDLKLAFELHKKFSLGNCASFTEEAMAIKPAPVITIPETDK